MENDEADKLREELKRMIDQSAEVPHGYLGTGVWIRITHRFRTRQTEWLLATITALLGAVTLLPGRLFDLPGYAGFKQIFGSEVLLGVGLVTLGILRIIGLFVNGARKNVTPHIRMFSAACGCMIFAIICYCYTLSGLSGWWLAIYPIFVGTELRNVYNAAHDVGEASEHSDRESGRLLGQAKRQPAGLTSEGTFHARKP